MMVVKKKSPHCFHVIFLQKELIRNLFKLTHSEYKITDLFGKESFDTTTLPDFSVSKLHTELAKVKENLLPCGSAY